MYSPEQMEMDLQGIQKQYELDVQIIGQTEKGKNIKAVKLGKRKKIDFAGGVTSWTGMAEFHTFNAYA
ncbi:hypothetical protein RCO48_37075 [Peribacillus frigoritolerans]|nr:hypothetical protein [Peribacillus frigoritolerans]